MNFIKKKHIKHWHFSGNKEQTKKTKISCMQDKSRNTTNHCIAYWKEKGGEGGGTATKWQSKTMSITKTSQFSDRMHRCSSKFFYSNSVTFLWIFIHDTSFQYKLTATSIIYSNASSSMDPRHMLYAMAALLRRAALARQST